MAVNPFKAGIAGAPRLVADQLPYHPVSCLENLVAGIVDPGFLFENLHDLWNHPFAGDFSAIEGQPLFSHGFRLGVQFIGAVLGRMMLPKLHIGMGSILKPLGLAERRAVCQRGENRAGGKIHADPYNILRRYPGFFAEARL